MTAFPLFIQSIYLFEYRKKRIKIKGTVFFKAIKMCFTHFQHNDHHHSPARKRSILVNGGQGNNHGDGESIYSHHSHGKQS